MNVRFRERRAFLRGTGPKQKGRMREEALIKIFRVFDFVWHRSGTFARREKSKSCPLTVGKELGTSHLKSAFKRSFEFARKLNETICYGILNAASLYEARVHFLV